MSGLWVLVLISGSAFLGPFLGWCMAALYVNPDRVYQNGYEDGYDACLDDARQDSGQRG